MTDKNRRKALKIAAVSAPVVWVKPAVDSIVLPAHGQTSGETSVCVGCMEVLEANFYAGNYFKLTGTGSEARAEIYAENTCGGNFIAAPQVVVADSPEEAATQYNIIFTPSPECAGEDMSELNCGIYLCDG